MKSHLPMVISETRKDSTYIVECFNTAYHDKKYYTLSNFHIKEIKFGLYIFFYAVDEISIVIRAYQISNLINNS